MSGYAELHAHSAFSFLDGANHPAELVAEAHRLGLSALALTDHDGLYGVVQLAQAARSVGLPTVLGAELNLGTNGRATPSGGTGNGVGATKDPDGEHLVVLARDPAGYRRLSAAIARAHLRGSKGQPAYDLAELAEQAAGSWLLLTGCRKGGVQQALTSGGEAAAARELDRLTSLFGRDNVAVEITHHGTAADDARHAALAGLARDAGLPLVATGAVHCARPQDQRLADVLAATRARSTLEEMAGWLPPAAAHLRSAAEMRARHHRYPHAVDASVRLAEECAFDLRLVAPQLPPHPVPPGHTEASWLRELTWRGAHERYGPPEAERQPGAYEQLAHELDVITELGFPGYFLIVHEIVDFCRRQHILCQGRGSAANSAVCFALGITAVDAVQHRLLFERFLSPGRSGPPDIDLDIESHRREEVIQFVYSRYGREHAAQVANVISYRPRSAVRDAARALGYDVGQQDAWAKSIERWSGFSRSDASDVPELVVEVADQLLRLPRHLGLHPGGMVLCDRPVIEVCPVQWAATPGRTVLQWDKDDCAEAGLVKFDLLGLGMLTALRIAFDTINESRPAEAPLGLHSLPQEDPRVFDLLCAAETVGVFQVESRAQMATLPRLRPRTFYDIVVEVALIRPGPIQGQSVNPYINRRRGREPVTYLHPLLEPALAKTLGVPLFQEQLMQIAIDVAGFTASEADELRKAMGAKRSEERMAALRQRLMTGMTARGVTQPVAEQIYDKLKAFADFGFPESHAFSFAYLVYASAWLKVHHPEAFYAALLSSQPMGFYSPQSLVADARRHGVKVLRADVQYSQVHATVEALSGGAEADPTVGGGGQRLVDADPGLALRLGLAPMRGLGEDAAERIVAARDNGGPFRDMADLARRTRLTAAQLETLATGGALAGLGMGRREALWAAGVLAEEHRVLPHTAVGETAPMLPGLEDVEVAVGDVWATGVSPDSFPTQFLRPDLDAKGIVRIADLPERGSGTRVRVAGVVTHRQRPSTAAGVTFLSLEDETGLLNVVCSPGLWQRYRRVARGSAALVVRGVIEQADGVLNLVADKLWGLPLQVATTSRDFR
ncbi:MAG TPA: error-prone DNA polymerase [Actinomycetaceae bacterium]|nr:error-prone DNA polymerase [Actinomycetaceae bacterium]